jgi:PAS domain-containing protein
MSDDRRAAVPVRLAAWRAAERRWERVAPAEEVRRSALEVVRAWAAYQNAAHPGESDEFLLVADDEGVYVDATERVTSVLGYHPSELRGRRGWATIFAGLAASRRTGNRHA